MSVRAYIEAMPQGHSLLPLLDEPADRLLLAYGSVPSGLLRMIPDSEELGDSEVAASVFFVQPVVAEIIEWENRTAVNANPIDHELVAFGLLPEWARVNPVRAARLIAKAHDFAGSEVLDIVEDACLATNASVFDVLAAVLSDYWALDDVEEFVSAAAIALSPRSASC